VTQQCRAAPGASGSSTKLEADRHTQLASEIPEFTVRKAVTASPAPGLSCHTQANTISHVSALNKPKACPFELNGNGRSEMHLPNSQRHHFIHERYVTNSYGIEGESTRPQTASNDNQRVLFTAVTLNMLV
jgi:hypothetical protein